VPTPEDVLEGIENQFSAPEELAFPFESPTARHAAAPAEAMSVSQIEEINETILGLLSPTPVQIDELVRLSGAHASAVATAVLELELSGQAVRHPGGGVSAI